MQNFIQVNNFKKYIQTPEVALSDYNFFVGTNSSGKSTLVKAYMLITKFISSDKLMDIDFTSDLYLDLNIQDFQRLKCKFSTEEDNVTIKLGLNNYIFELVLIPHEKSNYAKVLTYNIYDIANDLIYKYEYIKGNTLKEYFNSNEKTGEAQYEERLKEELFSIEIINNEKYIDPIISLLEYKIANEEDLKTRSFLNKELNTILNSKKFKSSIKLEGQDCISTNSFKEEVKTIFNKASRNKIASIESYNPSINDLIKHYRVLNVNNKSTDSNFISLDEMSGKTEEFKLPKGMELATTIEKLIKTIAKIGSVFLPLTYRKYTNLNAITDKSNDLAQLTHNYYNAKDRKKEIADNFIKYWISKNQFNIGEDFEINFYGGEAYEILIHENGIKIPLTDKGTGNVQIFKILVLIATQIRNENRNTTIILEEPELNLHPSLQSKLADLICTLNTYCEDNRLGKYYFSFMVETHSEYLIRKLQVLSIYNKVNRNTLSLNYFPSEMNEDPYQLKIREDGSLDKNFGSGFLDEAGNHMLEIMKFNLTSKN